MAKTGFSCGIENVCLEETTFSISERKRINIGKKLINHLLGSILIYPS